MALPKLGGAPAVWNVAMLFYQAMLLAGYVYAHALSRINSKRQLAIHMAAFALASLTLPIGLSSAMDGTGMSPAAYLLVLFAVSIGPVFFVVASQAPLIQSWFARGDGTAAEDPYFLYAASNAGSLLALLTYPLLVEPELRLGEQAWVWSSGFIVLAILTAVCGLRVQGDRPPAAAKAEPTAWRLRIEWVLLAAIPSGLLLSSTTHLTTDIMAMPLLWVIPLAIYLATYILAFAQNGAIFVGHAQRAAPVLLLLLGGYTFLAQGVIALLMALSNLVLLFFVALALHGRLAARRPSADQLTDFYLWISVGGVLGGLFSAIVAPLAFDWVYEHPILLVAAAVLLPAKPLSRLTGLLWQGRRGQALRYLMPIAAIAASWWVHVEIIVGERAGYALPGLSLIATGAVLSIGQRIPFAVCFAAMMLALGGWKAIGISGIEGARERSFFGIYTVKADTASMVRKLEHGTTLHGVQSLLPQLQTMPQSYYSRGSGVGQAMLALPSLAGPEATVGFVGLGAGSLACYAQDGQHWTAFEIDPTVVRIAKDTRLFTYLARCAPDLRIVIGDARLSIAAETARSYDLLAIDAFSSDAIPMHMMTLEAFQVFERALKPDGLLLIHISNRHIDLEPVVAAIAAKSGWAARVLDHQPKKTDLPGISFARSDWIAMAPSEARLQEFVKSGEPGASQWKQLRTRKGMKPWTDDYASIIPVLKF